MSLKVLVLRCIRAIGGFALAQWLTRKRLRILCYHGFSIGDEYLTSPHMFMRGSTFERRMQTLQRRRLPVVTLDEAVRRLNAGKIQSAETVLTFDDGWESNLTIGLPILERYKFPACIYITTEHLAANMEVFNVVLGHMMNRTTRDVLTLAGIHPLIDGTYDLKADKNAAFFRLIGAAEQAFPIGERNALLEPIAAGLGMDLKDVLRDGRFRLLTREQIVELDRRGVDIELHTHTHRLPDSNFEAMAYEINENRRAIRDLLGRDKHHFCYPSGVYTMQHPQWLAQLNVASGTTCDPGMNRNHAPPLLLKRYLDHDDGDDIEFEAEVSGLRELARSLRATLAGKAA